MNKLKHLTISILLISTLNVFAQTAYIGEAIELIESGAEPEDKVDFVDGIIEECKKKANSCNRIAVAIQNKEDFKNTDFISWSILPALIKANTDNNNSWCNDTDSVECKGYLKLLFENRAFPDPLDGHYKGYLLGKNLRKQLNSYYKHIISPNENCSDVAMENNTQGYYKSDDAGIKIKLKQEICVGKICDFELNWLVVDRRSPFLGSSQYYSIGQRRTNSSCEREGMQLEFCDFSNMWLCLPDSKYSNFKFDSCKKDGLKSRYIKYDILKINNEKIMNIWACAINKVNNL